MKTWKMLTNEEVEEKCIFEVYECNDCGFHLGLDHSFIDQVSEIKIKCPSCGNKLDTGDFE